MHPVRSSGNPTSITTRAELTISLGVMSVGDGTLSRGSSDVIHKQISSQMVPSSGR